MKTISIKKKIEKKKKHYVENRIKIVVSNNGKFGVCN